MAQVKYDVSGIGNFDVWKAISKNIVAQKDLFVTRLEDSADVTQAVTSSYNNQADYQYNQLEDQKNQTISQGWSGIVSGGVSAAVELYSVGNSFKFDGEADSLQKEVNSPTEVISSRLEEIDSASVPSSSSAGKSTSNPAEEVVANVSRRVGSSESSEEETPQQVVQNSEEETRLDIFKSKVEQEDLLEEEKALDSIDNKEKERTIQQLRRTAEMFRMGGSALAQSTSSICSGIGALVQAGYKNAEAADTKMMTLYQGGGTVLQQIIQQIQAMEQAADTSQQGTLSTLASLIAASTIRG